MIEQDPEAHALSPPSGERVGGMQLLLLPGDASVVLGQRVLVVDVGTVADPATSLDLDVVDLPEVEFPLHH